MGKTSQSKYLSKLYNLRYISVDEILKEWDEGNQMELMKKNVLYGKIVKKLKTGKLLSSDLTAELVKSLLKDSAYLQGYNGWVLDGFPRTADEVQLSIYDCP